MSAEISTSHTFSIHAMSEEEGRIRQYKISDTPEEAWELCDQDFMSAFRRHEEVNDSLNDKFVLVVRAHRGKTVWADGAAPAIGEAAMAALQGDPSERCISSQDQSQRLVIDLTSTSLETLLHALERYFVYLDLPAKFVPIINDDTIGSKKLPDFIVSIEYIRPGFQRSLDDPMPYSSFGIDERQNVQEALDIIFAELRADGLYTEPPSLNQQLPGLNL